MLIALRDLVRHALLRLGLRRDGAAMGVARACWAAIEWLQAQGTRGLRLLRRAGWLAYDAGQTFALLRLLAGGATRPVAGPPLYRHVVMLVVSDIRVDPRVQKAALVAVRRGFRVTVVAPSHRLAMPAPARPDWGPGIEFAFPELFSPALLNHHYPWLVDTRLLRFARQFRNVVFHGHDLNTALMALALARDTGSACVADFHEWFSENVEWSKRSNGYVRNRWLKRVVMRRAERLCMRDAAAVVTVCQSIAGELQAMHPRADGVRVVRNIPELDGGAAAGGVADLRTLAGVAPGEFLALWQGGVGPSRLLEPVIEALRHAPGVTLAIRGPGLEAGSAVRRHYEAVAAGAGVDERLRLLPPVPSRLVVPAAAGADCGVWTLPNLSKNFYYALPNKIFEYLAAGVPVLVADFPEAAGMVKRYGVGLAFDPYDPVSIGGALSRLRDDRALRDRMAVATAPALADMDAAREWAQVADLYEAQWRASGASA
jgi:glycosyltransferase involved in cell wall biosynthesis